MFFNYSREYAMLNAGAHLKPPARITSPSLAWHYALWIPPNPTKPDETPAQDDQAQQDEEAQSHPNKEFKTFEGRRVAWIRRIDWLLARLIQRTWADWAAAGRPADTRPQIFTERRSDEDNADWTVIDLFRHRVRNTTEGGGAPSFELEYVEGGLDQYRYEVFSLTFYYWGDIKVKMRACLHSEFVTFTYIAEVRMPEASGSADVPAASDDDDASDLPPREKTFRHLQVASNLTQERYRRLQDATPPAGHDLDLDGEILLNDVRAIKEHSDYLFAEFWDDFQKHFNDLFNTDSELVVRDVFERETKDGPPPDARGVLTLPRAALTRRAIGNAFADFRGLIVSPVLKPSEPGSQAKIELNPPRDASLTPPRLRDLNSRRVSDLVDALLPIVERDAPPADRGRSRFTMSEHTASRFLAQKGLYLSSLGARPNADHADRDVSPVRYMLLFERGNRWQLGRLVERLHLLGTLRLAAVRNLKVLNKASESLRDFGRSIENFDEERDREPDSDWRRTQRQLRDQNELFGEIGKACDGGLLYRIERSRYFVANFNRNVQSLRIRRIEGYQPYDEFVHRRLGSTWDSISRLGVRYDNARRRLDSLNTKIASSAQIDQQRAQVRLQSFAELAAALPVAYYGGHIALGLSDVIDPDGFSWGPQWYWDASDDGRWAIWSVVTFVAYVLVLWVVHAIHHAEDRDMKRRRAPTKTVKSDAGNPAPPPGAPAADGAPGP